MNRDEIIQELQKLGWHPRTVAVWHRARYRCEYCDKSLIATAADHFCNAEIDHVVPYAGDDLENLALACHACNRIKRHKNFTEVGQLNARSDLIMRARHYIQTITTRDEARLEVAKRLFQLLDKA